MADNPKLDERSGFCVWTGERSRIVRGPVGSGAEPRLHAVRAWPGDGDAGRESKRPPHSGPKALSFRRSYGLEPEIEFLDGLLSGVAFFALMLWGVFVVVTH